MDQLKQQIQLDYQNHKFSANDIESLEVLCQTLLKPVREERKEQKNKKDKQDAWEEFWVDREDVEDIKSNFEVKFNLETYPAIISYLKEISRGWDVRSWNGEFTGKNSTCFGVMTTLYFYPKKIYLITSEWGNWWSDNLEFNEKEYVELIKLLITIKNNQLWRYLDCPNCDDKCKCWMLHHLDEKTFRKLLDQPNKTIEMRNQSLDPSDRYYLNRKTSSVLDQMKDNLEKLHRFYISESEGSCVVYQENHYFGELDY